MWSHPEVLDRVLPIIYVFIASRDSCFLNIFYIKKFSCNIFDHDFSFSNSFHSVPINLLTQLYVFYVSLSKKKEKTTKMKIKTNK